MGKGKRVLIVGMVRLPVLVAVAAIGWMSLTVEAGPVRPANAASAAPPGAPGKALSAPSLPQPKPHVFTPAELKTFLADVTKADLITDPLKRCVAYPDPPGSHWSPESVKAYCLYHLQSTISFDQAQELIRAGHAAELDRRLAKALQAQSTKPESVGLLDHTYFNAFSNGTFDARSTLDAWKRASPHSAFAFAASGFAYVAMAADARGGAYIQDTPQSKIDAMERLLRLADTDLQHAVALDPKVTPAYVAMINAGSMALGDTYVFKAATLGLAHAPADYAIYGLLSHAAEPKWGGSLQAMKVVTRMAQGHVKENPLLAILQTAEPLVEYDVCDCRGATNWKAFPLVFDNIGSTQELFAAGNVANSHGHFDLAVVYLSEGLRFLPGAYIARQHRDEAMSDLGETTLALDDATRWIKQAPDRPWGYDARGYAYKTLGDEPHAAADLQRAVALDPGDMFPLSQMAEMYLGSQEWDKALGVADQMVRTHADEPDGWVVRAMAQRAANRPGLADTARYFLGHFGDDPSQRQYAAMMRAMLAEQADQKPAAPGGKAAGKAAVASH